MAATSTLVIDQTTILSLLSALGILIIAYIASLYLLPNQSSSTSPTSSSSTTAVQTPPTPKTRILFIWHAFDALIHFIFEGSFLYHCFFTYTSLSASSLLDNNNNYNNNPDRLTAPGVYFLERPDRLYGSFYGQSPTAKLWQEYAKADRRWGGADLGVISLELLTVFGAGPIAAYVCYLLVKGDKEAKLWFWATVLATGELYGGFMTFAPEWLTGSPNLDTSNFMYMWVYLFFFNMLWVFIPLWVLYEANSAFQSAFTKASDSISVNSVKKRE